MRLLVAFLLTQQLDNFQAYSTSHDIQMNGYQVAVVAG